MGYCSLTYDKISDNLHYSNRGLQMLAPGLDELYDFPYDIDAQIKEVIKRSDKMSIQGIQPKLSVLFRPSKKLFEVVDIGGMFIIKPSLREYYEVPENEDLSMRMAKAGGIDVPFHGLIYACDGSLVYVIKRFDRLVKNGKVHCEDFSQLLEQTRDTKYSASMERVAEVIEQYCTYPVVEKTKLFRRVIFSFLIGNEDMHLKNFSLIYPQGKPISLSPAYDLLSTTLAMGGGAKEESALTINGKKNKLTREDFIEYYGVRRLGLPNKIIDRIMNEIHAVLQSWNELISRSFLSEKMKEMFKKLLEERVKRLYL